MVGTFRYTVGGGYNAGASFAIELQDGSVFSPSPSGVPFDILSVGSDLDSGLGGSTILEFSQSFVPNELLYDRFGNPLDTGANGFLFDLSDDSGFGRTFLYGGSFGDVLIAGAGDSNLFGGGGGDSLTGGGGRDLLAGGGGADILRGGAGSDIAWYVTSAAPVTVNLTSWTASGGDAAGDTFPDEDIEDLDGSFGDDDLTGNGRANYLQGRGGADILRGLDGNDTLVGDAGADLLEGGAGNDTLVGGNDADDMRGGTGNDTYLFAAGDTITELAGGGADTVLASVDYTLGAELERLFLSSGAASGTGNGGDNFLYGNTGANTLTGRGGRDRLDGRGGADAMAGGTGDDIYVVDDLGDTIAEAGGEGRDVVQVRVDGYVLADGTVVEDLRLGGGILSATGNGRDNAIDGNVEANTLAGGAGDDRLNGKGGADVLIGGAGADSLIGGAGADSFRFDSLADGADFVSRFRAGTDEVALAAGLFGASAPVPGALDPALFRSNGTGRAEEAGDRVIYNAGNGALWFDADGTGAGGSVLLARFTGAPALTAGDFAVV